MGKYEDSKMYNTYNETHNEQIVTFEISWLCFTKSLSSRLKKFLKFLEQEFLKIEYGRPTRDLDHSKH